MKDEIKVEEYVRDRGEILQVEVITNIKEDSMYIKFKEYAGGNTFYKSEIKEWKHSKNIIDLIEVGDIVKVLDIDWIRVMNIDDIDFLEAFKEEIEEKNWELLAIATKEQFAQMEYKVKE